MHATGKWHLEGPGRLERAPKAVRTPAWPTSHYHHIFLGVRARRASDLFSLPRLSYSADAHRAIRFRLLTIYSIAVAYVSENARQRVSPLVSGVRAGLSGVRRVRVVSVQPFPLELAKRNIFARSIDRNPEQNDEGGAFPLVRRASSSDMTCYSAVHLLHFYVSKSLHSYAGGVRNTADLILIEG